ncbi:hypothetical protein [Clostridium botulinum]|nr:hypothetical protein [Clostridium botulinum]
MNNLTFEVLEGVEQLIELNFWYKVVDRDEIDNVHLLIRAFMR